MGNHKFWKCSKTHSPQNCIGYCFPIEDLRQTVETAKRILTKEKLDKQLAGQLSSTPFMSIRDGHHSKVSFDTREELGYKIDKLAVMIGNSQQEKEEQIDNSNHKFIRVEVEARTGVNNQISYQNRYNNRSNIRERGQYRQDRSRPRYAPRYEENYTRGKF